MAYFDYRGQDNAELIGEAYELAAYTASFFGGSEPDGWEELSARDLGISSFRTDFYGYFTANLDGQAKVLVKRGADGDIEQMAISFAATNSLIDIYDYPSVYARTYDNAYDYLFEAVAEYAEDHGVSGSDVIITGYSLGGGAVNAAADGRNFNADGYFSDSNYIGFASPMITTGENVFNFGFENDAVYRLERGNETSVDNLVLFDGTYASPTFAIGGITLATPGGWDAHLEGFNSNEEIFSSIADSYFYEMMDQDDLVIVASLNGFDRGSTWVEPVDRGTGYHDGESAFVLGNSGADLLRGDNANDYIDGHGGNDTLNGRGGDDALFGGAGNDTLTGGAGDDTFIFTAGFGDDRITDFDEDDDMLVFDSSVFGSYSDLMDSTYNTGGDVVIQSGGDSIRIDDISLNDLDAGNFAFV